MKLVRSVVRHMLIIAMLCGLVWAEPLVLDGLIEPSLIVNVGTSVPGVLKTVDVERGDMVKKGQILARLRSGVEKATMELARARSELEATINERQARVDFAIRKQERYKELYEKKVIPFEKMDEAKTDSIMALMDLEEAREELRLAKLELNRSVEVVKRMSIYSPISGVVMERFLSPGEFVEDQPVLKLAKIHPLHVEIFAPVDLIGAIKVGMDAEVTPENAAGQKVYKAKVTIVDRVIDAASGTFGVRLELPNPKHRLPAGLKCRVAFHQK